MATMALGLLRLAEREPPCHLQHIAGLPGEAPCEPRPEWWVFIMGGRQIRAASRSAPTTRRKSA